MMYINTQCMSGRLVAPATLKYLPDGTPKLEFTICCPSSKRKGDEWDEEPEYFEVEKIGRGADKLASLMTKGRSISIQGKLRQSRWTESNGTKRQKVYIVADVIVPGIEPQGAASTYGANSPDEIRPDTNEDCDDVPWGYN